jgi:hypothetical protein
VRVLSDDHVQDSLTQFASIIDFVQDERAEALQDRRFAFIAGAQWEGSWGEQFANVPMVEINKTAAGLDKIINDYRANRLTVNFRPTDDKASEDTAEAMNGMFRADAYWSKAQQALDNAFEEGSAGGYGAWRCINEYEDPYDPDDDRQRIKTIAIMDADQCVFWDPNAKLYDKSDAMYCFVITAMATATFEDRYPGKTSQWPDGITKWHYDWYTPNVVRVAEKYEVEVKTQLRRVFSNAIVGEEQRFWDDEIDEADVEDLIVQGWREEQSKKVKRRRVAKYVMSGCEELEPKRYIAGTEIPVIPFYGQRRFIDNMERACGHVRKAKDGARVYNTMISGLVENASLSPREKPIFDPEQIGGLEETWTDQDIGRKPYALARALRNEDGTIAALGPIGMVQPPQLPPVHAALIQICANDINELTNAVDGADQAQSNLSAEAMDIAATRTDAKSAIYMDNMRQSVQRWGEVYASMIGDVAVEEGRKYETLGENGEEGHAVLFEPFTDELGKYTIRNDLSKGKYKTIADVTEATATRRDKTVKNCLNGAQIVGAFDPELAGALVTTAYMNMDGEGMNDLQDWLRQRAIRSGLVKPSKEEQQQLEMEAANQQPDAQTQALQAVAQKEGALAVKAEADTEQSKAKTVLTLAQAAKVGAETGHTIEETKHIGEEMQMKAANDAQEPRKLPSPSSGSA